MNCYQGTLPHHRCQNSLQAPQHPLPPIPRDTGRDVLSPLKGHLSEQQVELPQIVDRRHEKTRNIMKRTSNVPRIRAGSTRKEDALRLYPLPLFSHRTVLQDEAVGENYVDSQSIRKSPKTKHLDKLKTTGLDLKKSSSTPKSANSIVATPSEWYGTRPKLSLATSIPIYDSGYRLTPIEVDLGVLEVIASMPDSNTSTKKAFVCRMPSKNAHYTSGNERMMRRTPSVTMFELPSGSVVAVITPRPEQNTWHRSIYLPGKILIEMNSPGGLSLHLTPLDLLQEATESVDIQLRNKVEEDQVDEIVEFFQSFGSGFDFDSIHTSLDTFWAASPILQTRFCSSISHPTRGSSAGTSAKPSVPSWYHSLPGEFFSTDDESFGLSDQDSSERAGKRMSIVMPLSQQFDSCKPPPYSPALPTSPLTCLSPAPHDDSHRKLKSSLPSRPWISFRRLLYRKDNLF
jgi:hypothetical protein